MFEKGSGQRLAADDEGLPPPAGNRLRGGVLHGDGQDAASSGVQHRFQGVRGSRQSQGKHSFLSGGPQSSAVADVGMLASDCHEVAGIVNPTCLILRFRRKFPRDST
jgi:hypothetical protein